ETRGRRLGDGMRRMPDTSKRNGSIVCRDVRLHTPQVPGLKPSSGVCVKSLALFGPVGTLWIETAEIGGVSPEGFWQPMDDFGGNLWTANPRLPAPTRGHGPPSGPRHLEKNPVRLFQMRTNWSPRPSGGAV